MFNGDTGPDLKRNREGGAYYQVAVAMVVQRVVLSWYVVDGDVLVADQFLTMIDDQYGLVMVGLFIINNNMVGVVVQ